MIKLALSEDGIPDFLLMTATSESKEIARVHLCKDDFNETMNVKSHPVIVTAIRIAADLKTASEGNWQSAATFLNSVDDASAFAASLGYNLTDWL